MIPDEIIRHRVPPAFGNWMPSPEFNDPQDSLSFPSSIDPDGYSDYGASKQFSQNTISDTGSQSGPQRIEGEDPTGKNKIASPSLLPGGYSHRLATNRTLIASDIRKYLSSIHVNPVRSSSYFENRRRLTKFSYMF